MKVPEELVPRLRCAACSHPTEKIHGRYADGKVVCSHACDKLFHYCAECSQANPSVYVKTPIGFLRVHYDCYRPYVAKHGGGDEQAMQPVPSAV